MIPLLVFSLFLTFSCISAEVTGTPFKCPPHFRNVVFNSGGRTQQGYPQPRWDTLRSHGISDWVGFLNLSMAPIPSNEIPLIVKRNVPRILASPSYVDDAVKLLESDNPPAYLEMFNEPDFIWNGTDKKKKTPPIPAAKALKPILEGKWPNTTLVSPALAKSGNSSDWWHRFNSPEGCNGCLNTTKIPIMAGHFYDLNPQRWLNRLARFAGLFPDKDIWVTEMAPATRLNKNCTLSHQEMKDWMTTVVKAMVTETRFSNVKRMYWNAGEWSPFNEDEDVCNHSLTYANGTATELLKHYSSLCE